MFLCLGFFWGIQGTVGGLPGGREAADEQNTNMLDDVLFYFIFSTFSDVY